MLNQYSPEFSCLFQGINHLYTLAGQAIYNNQIHLSATVDNQNLGPYKPGNQPKLVNGLGPNCFGLPNPPRPFQIPGKYRCINDGAALTRDACAQRAGSPPPTAAPASLDNTALNSAAENAYVNTLIAGDLHTTPNKVPGTATLLAGPLLRGQQVVIK